MLPKLRVLFLQKNQLTTVPAALKDRPCLERVNVTDNPLEATDELRETLSVLRASAADKGGFVRAPPGLQ